MESARNFPRKARELSKLRQEEQSIKKIALKRTSPETEDAPNKKRVKPAKGEAQTVDESVKVKKTTTASSKAISEGSSASEKTRVIAKTDAKKKQTKSKTDDDIKQNGNETKVKPSRRSKSADPISLTAASKKRTAKKDVIAEEQLLEAKKGGGKITEIGVKSLGDKNGEFKIAKSNGTGKSSAASTAEPKKASRSKRAAPVNQASNEKINDDAEIEKPEIESDASVPLKKVRAKKGPVKQLSNDEEDAEMGEPEDESTIKVRGKKAAPVKQSSNEEANNDSNEESKVVVPPKKVGRGKKEAHVQEASNGKDEDSEIEEGEPDTAAPQKKGRGKKAAPAKQSSKDAEDVEMEDDSSVKAPEKKGRGQKEVPVQDASNGKDEDSEMEEDESDAAAPQKKGRGKKAAPAKQSSKDAEDVEMENESSVKAPEKKGRGKKEVPVQDASNGKDEDSEMEEGESDAAAPQKKGRGKKTAPAKQSSKDVEDVEMEDETSVKAPEKKGRGKKAAPAQSSADADEENVDQPKKLLNNVNTDYSSMNFDIEEEWNFKITTWNVASLTTLANKNPDYFTREDADIICINELKCADESKIPDQFKLDGYHAYWNIGKGVGGVAILSKVKPLKVTYDLPDTDFSDDKRMITAEYENFYLVSTYVVNSGRGLKTLDRRMEWNEVFDQHIKTLDAKKPVVIAGDLNVSHQEIDLANPKSNKKSAGFTQEERDGFSKLLSYGFVDTYRHFYPDKTGAYTFWTYLNSARSKNVGWRLDYFVVSKRFMKHVKDNVIRSNVLGSDHCPSVLFMNF